MKVAITGSSGMIGSALRSSLLGDGHDVLRLVRRDPDGPDEVPWDPASGVLDPSALEGVDAVVNLAGAGVGDHRWTSAYKRTILDSRVDSTRTVAEAIAAMHRPPAVLVSGSAMGFYGTDRGTDPLDEDDAGGTGFLADVVRQWEAAAAPAEHAGVSVRHPRIGMVMTAGGGALGRMLPLFRLGVGGTLGGGRQYWSPISLSDCVRALRFLAETPGLTGPYNLTGPEPVTNAEFTRVLGRAVHRPTMLPVPAVALRLALGEFSGDVLGSLRVLPERLVGSGFTHEHPDATSIVASALEDRPDGGPS